jgi:hypothetical protein
MMGDAMTLATELARAIYRLTDGLPETEPLRIKLREAALDIAAGNSREASPAIAVMSRLLYVAEAQGFAREENFALLDRSYRGLQDIALREQPMEPVRTELPDEFRAGPPDRTVVRAGSEETEEELAYRHDGAHKETALKTLNARQKKIVQHFRYRQAFQLRDARALFEGYSQKTLRNDLRDLCLKGILNREGVGTTSFYRVVLKMPNS